MDRLTHAKQARRLLLFFTLAVVLAGVALVVQGSGSSGPVNIQASEQAGPQAATDLILARGPEPRTSPAPGLAVGSGACGKGAAGHVGFGTYREHWAGSWTRWAAGWINS